jgi:hypothetical protein
MVNCFSAPIINETTGPDSKNGGDNYNLLVKLGNLGSSFPTTAQITIHYATS